MNHAGLLGQNGLGVNGRHAEEGDDPHPEDGARAAHEDGAAGADDVAGSHLGGDGGGQGLKGAQATLLSAAPHGEAAEDPAHALSEAADLNEPGLAGEKDASAHEKDHEDVVGQVEVDGLHNALQRFHGISLPKCKIKRAAERLRRLWRRTTQPSRARDGLLCPFA